MVVMMIMMLVSISWLDGNVIGLIWMGFDGSMGSFVFEVVLKFSIVIV